jgi:immune inhibitor A
MNKNNSILFIIVSILLALCLCVIVLLAVAYLGLRELKDVFPTLVGNVTDMAPVPSTPTPFEIPRLPTEEVSSDTLALLKRTDVPVADMHAIVCRLKDICNIPLTLPGPSAPLEIGAQEPFWVTDTDTNEDFQVTATLRYITEHAYFWVENGVSYDNTDMKNLLDTFEEKIYPTDREFFGSEWTPGVDGDPHLYILYASGVGSVVAGYYSSGDEVPAQVRAHSNAHEMFVMNASEDLGAEYTYGILAHEFQHMIHSNQDPNEGALLDEGFAELASFLNGYYSGWFAWFYLSDTDLNLTDWSTNTEEDTPHYGANFLFTKYFLDRFGERTTKELVQNQLNNLESVDDTLLQQGVSDALTGVPVTADDFFQDWTITNYLGDPSVGDGRYTYKDYSNLLNENETETISTCPVNGITRTVNQYGVDYIRITCPGAYTLQVTGATVTPLLPTEPHSGSRAFWSNMGNNSDMTVTREFDFTSVPDNIELNYWTWYDIEEDWDYLYLEGSTDGEHWEILNTPSGTSYNPVGNSFGFAYTGQTNGWIMETVDLSEFAGQKVSLRFEYMTDTAVYGDGFLLDDLSIPAIGYSTDFEADTGGWEAAGFVRIQNVLPQTFRLALITHGTNGSVVQYIPMSTDQTAEIPLTIGQGGVSEAVLVISGTTRFTRQLAGYQITIR